MKKRLPAILCAALLSASLLSGCATDKKYTEEEYQTNYDTGYQAGYDAGVKEGVAQDRAAQVQTMDYETFRALNEQNQFTAVIYVGRAACPYCGLVTDYMRSVTNLPISVFYVSLEPYYNSPYYEDYKAELGIEYVPTFIYYENGVPKYYMDSPVPEGYFDESGDDRTAAYDVMVDTINAFIQGCAAGDPASVDGITVREAGADAQTEESTEADTADSTAEETSADSAVE